MSYERGWTSVEDVERTLVEASRIRQGSVGTQRPFVPPIPAPQLQNKIAEDPYSMFNRKHEGIRPLDQPSTRLAATYSYKKCYFCGCPKHRTRQQCPAIDSSCERCGKIGHWTSFCRAHVLPDSVTQIADSTAFFDRGIDAVQNGPSIFGRGQMIIEQGKRYGYQDQRIAQDLKVVSGYGGGYSDSDVQQILSSSGQFDDDSEEDPNEPSFGCKKKTSTPSTSGIKNEAEDVPNEAELDLAKNPQVAGCSSGTNDIKTVLENPKEPDSQLDFATDNVALPADQPDANLDQSDHSYSDQFYYTFDDSFYVKGAPLTSGMEAPTPSPCSSPLPHHSTIDGHYVGCVQMESDDSSSPSPITVEIEDVVQPRNVADDFIIQLRTTLPDDYEEVMSVWKDYQAGQITSSSLELQISRLLGPFPDLMDAFFKFTSVITTEEPESLITEPRNGELPDDPNNKILDESICENIETDVSVTKELEVRDDWNNKTPDEPVREVRLETNEVPNEKTKSEEFEDYIKFCRLVKKTYSSQPEIFSEFLELLNEHKEAKIDKQAMVERASRLFHYHLELVEGFKKLTVGNFCPVLLKTAGSVAEKSELKKVGRLSDSTRPRRCRNALILNLLKKEAAWKQDSVSLSGTEVEPDRVVDNNCGLNENRVEDLDKIFSIKACDENGNSDVQATVCVLNDLSIPSCTTLGFNRAESVIGEINNSNVLDNSVCNSNSVPSPVKSYDVPDQSEPVYDLTTDHSNLERASDLEVVDSSTDHIRLSDVVQSLSILEKPLELLKPEDIIPDTNAEIPHSTVEILNDIVSAAMDSASIQGEAQELEVDFVGNNFLVSSEVSLKPEIELLKPSDFVHLESTVDDEAIVAPEGSVSHSSNELVPDKPKDVDVQLGEEVTRSDAVGVLQSADDTESVEVSNSIAIEAISSSEDVIVISAGGPSGFVRDDPSPADLATSTSDVILIQDQCCGVDSTSDPIQQCDIVENSEKELDTVVVALAKMDLNSDPDNELILDEPLIRLKTETEVSAEAVPLPVSSEEISLAESLETVADEAVSTEVTMTVQAASSDPQTSGTDQSPDQPSGSVPQVTPDCGPLLLRPDQFVTLSTAVDPHQVQQALLKHSEVKSFD